MILIVTNKKDYTADFLILELKRQGEKYVRFNLEDFPQHIRLAWKLNNGVVDGQISFPNLNVEFSEIHSVWYRRPVLPRPDPNIRNPAAYEFAASESQASLDGIWRTLDCFWVSHPDNLRKAESKLLQLKIAAKIGFSVWPTLLTNDPTIGKEFFQDQEENIIYKPINRAQLTRDGRVDLIYTNPVKSNHLPEFDRISLAPSLFQKYVPKKAEIRVTVIGNRIFAVELDSQSQIESIHDWRRGDTAKIRHGSHQLPLETENACRALVKELGLAFGAIDLILTPKGEYVFLEINPNGQWAWIQQMCPKVALRQTLTELLRSGVAFYDDGCDE
ncbi:MAG: hypothetical protein KJ970_03430 [Candidatus Eisenbacteria bacterium]|uniref:ATP-grasp domain-containing protein n=1 Tax=Eiseniibacteriota bacterium TaxID=2212470 RepID=A0A948RUT0_UNCEI|nr:hypothetical protein [Candidatus Eisenbacteria bacterium]MBU2689953.1 hypothetical protein [Candidatus Eisenbacteria bacterium]